MSSLGDTDANSWNSLTGGEYPFLRHEFLHALETCDCLQEAGWTPSHLLFETQSAGLVAAVPLYLKTNSFGEFVFDWSWADAYHRSGMEYYPKLVSAVPFTPATGPRILARGRYITDEWIQKILETATRLGESMNVSGLHWLFPPVSEQAPGAGLMIRSGCQFHWLNREYADFQAFLDQLTSKRRKQIRRERRQVLEAGVEMQKVYGNRATREQLDRFFDHYQSTFLQYGNYPALTREFFATIAATMGEQTLLVLASKDEQIIASAFFLVGSRSLYGRYWGCSEEIPGLHFETCYYQGIEFCIERGLQRFEPGAQGEHKISRGFLPSRTVSWHWLKNPRMHSLVDRAVQRESVQIDHYMKQMLQRSPYRQQTAQDPSDRS